MLKSCETYSASSLNVELLGAISRAAAAAVHAGLSRSSAPGTNTSLHQQCSSFIVWAFSNIKERVFFCRRTAPCKTSWSHLDGGFCATRSTDTLAWFPQLLATQPRFCNQVSPLRTPLKHTHARTCASTAGTTQSEAQMLSSWCVSIRAGRRMDRTQAGETGKLNQA